MTRPKMLLLAAGFIAIVYAIAFGVKNISYKKAAPLLNKMSAETNCAQPYLDGHYVEAFVPCREAAGQGHPMANTILAEMYYFGRGVQKDRATAYNYALAGAVQESKAQFLVGLILLERNESSDDIVQARGWLMKAAVKCHDVAPVALSGSYARSDYRDPFNAYVWAVLSTAVAARGPDYNRVIDKSRAELEAVLSPAQISEAVDQAAQIRKTFEPSCRA